MFQDSEPLEDPSDLLLRDCVSMYTIKGVAAIVHQECLLLYLGLRSVAWWLDMVSMNLVQTVNRHATGCWPQFASVWNHPAQTQAFSAKSFPWRLLEV